MEKVKCKNCDNIFSNIYRPYFPPCGHTICLQCINKIKSECLNDNNESFTSKSNTYFEKNILKVYKPDYDIELLLSDDEENTKKKKSLNESDSNESLNFNNSNLSMSNNSNHNNISNNNNSNNQFLNCSNISNNNSSLLKLDNEEKSNDKEEENGFNNSNEDYDNDDDNNMDIDNNNNENEDKSSSSSNESNDNSEIIDDENINYIINDDDKIKEEKSFKFKCPFCDIKVKLNNSHIRINTSILDFNNGFSNNEGNKKFYCQKCVKIIFNNKEHLEKNHDNFTLELNDKNFKLIRNYLYKYKKKCDEDTKILIPYLKSFIKFDKKIFMNLKNNIFNSLKSFNFTNIKNKAKEKINFINEQIKNKKNLIEKQSYLNSLKTLFSNYLTQNYKLRIITLNLILKQNFIMLLSNNIFKKSLLDYLNQGFFHLILNKTFYHQKKYIIIKDKNKHKCIYDYNLKRLFNIPKLNKLTSKLFVCDRKGEFIYCFGEEKKSSSHFKRFNIFEDEIENLPNITLPLFQFDLILYNNFIYIIGGKIDKNEYSKLCFQYNINKKEWTDFPQLNEQLKYKKITIIDNKLITFNNGGNEFLYSAEYIKIENELKNNNWEKIIINGYNNFLNQFELIPFNECILFLIDSSENIGYIINLGSAQVISTFKINKKIYMNKYFSSKLSKKIFMKNLLNINQNIYWKQLINIPLTLSNSKYIN